MYDRVTTPRGPNPVETYLSPPGPTLAKWCEHRSRRKFEAEVFQDLQRHPEIGVRQATSRLGNAHLYQMNAYRVDADLRRVPYERRLAAPPAGTFPLVVGEEVGTGPGPWWGRSPRELVGRRADRNREIEEEWNERSRARARAHTKDRHNGANYVTGPGVQTVARS